MRQLMLTTLLLSLCNTAQLQAAPDDEQEETYTESVYSLMANVTNGVAGLATSATGWLWPPHSPQVSGPIAQAQQAEPAPDTRRRLSSAEINRFIDGHVTKFEQNLGHALTQTERQTLHQTFMEIYAPIPPRRNSASSPSQTGNRLSFLANTIGRNYRMQQTLHGQVDGFLQKLFPTIDRLLAQANAMLVQEGPVDLRQFKKSIKQVKKEFFTHYVTIQVCAPAVEEGDKAALNKTLEKLAEAFAKIRTLDSALAALKQQAAQQPAVQVAIPRPPRRKKR